MRPTGTTDRNPALDYLRTFVIALVVLHHAVLAYTTFGRFDAAHYLWSTAPIVDSQRWAGFDLVVLFNDSFFMPLMFFLAGLFVLPGLARKGTARYLRDRLLRLGLPFAVVVVFIMPLAHYPSYHMTGSPEGYLAFWRTSLFHGPWPAGPAWFIWLLLAFDLVAATLYHTFRSRLGDGARAVAERPTLFFLLAGSASLAAYLPMFAAFGPTHWFAFGPFAVQASRVVFYAAYFAAGATAGASRSDRGLLTRDGPVARNWQMSAAAAVALFSLLVFMQQSGRAAGMAYAVAFVASCGTSCTALLGVFLRFATRHVSELDRLRDGAYGVYLVHYVFIVWLQFALLGSSMPVVGKALLVFAATAAASWSVVWALRRVPAIARTV